MLKALGDHAHCQGLELGHRLIAVSAIAGHARQCRHFGEPTTVVFALKLNEKITSAPYTRVGCPTSE